MAPISVHWVPLAPANLVALQAEKLAAAPIPVHLVAALAPANLVALHAAKLAAAQIPVHLVMPLPPAAAKMVTPATPVAFLAE